MSRKSSSASAQKILIVDDEADVAYSFQRVLAEEPVEVVGVTSGTEAFKRLKKDVYDLVLLDVRIGLEHGIEIFRQIRKEYPRQLVIVMTAHGTAQTAIEAMKLGAFDYILKPFDVPELLSILRRGLQAAASIKELASEEGEKVTEDKKFYARVDRRLICNAENLQTGRASSSGGCGGFIGGRKRDR